MRQLIAGMFAICAMQFSGCGNSEYNQGYGKAQREVRELRRDGGMAAEFGMQAGNAVGMSPSDENKSGDWNAGYRQGFKDELKK